MSRAPCLLLAILASPALSAPPASSLDLAARLRRGDGVQRDAPRALALYRRACESGDSGACRAWGEMARDGEGTAIALPVADQAFGRACAAGDQEACVGQGTVRRLTQDLPGATRLLGAACAAGAARGCTQLAFVRARGDAGKRDLPEAVRLLMKGCAGHDPEGCQALGVVYGTGSGDAAQEKPARALLEEQCAAGRGSGCYGLGLWYRQQASAALESSNAGSGHTAGKADTFARKALPLITRGCELGEAAACHDLGVFAERGTFGKPDPDEARRRYQRACDGGYALSCFNLAVSFDGLAGAAAADPARAERYYRKSCGLAEGQACYNLAWMFLAPPRAPAHEKEALQLLDELCGRDQGQACNKLGNEARSHQDLAGAIRWFRRACDSALAMGCNNLGVMLLGEDTPPKLRDEKAGRDALVRACAGGYGPACDTVKQLR